MNKEEPKEELEEIKLIDIHYENDKCIFKIYGQSIAETIAIKVNELIDEVNKLKKRRNNVNFNSVESHRIKINEEENE